MLLVMTLHILHHQIFDLQLNLLRWLHLDVLLKVEADDIVDIDRLSTVN